MCSEPLTNPYPPRRAACAGVRTRGWWTQVWSALAASLAVSGCLVEFPARGGDAGDGKGMGGSLSGFAGQPPDDGLGSAGGAGSPLDPDRKPPQGSPSGGPPGSDGPPPSAGPPSLPGSDPPPEGPCQAGLCEACNLAGERVALDSDARCPDTDCEAFPQVLAGRDPVTGGPFCRFLDTQMARTCAGPGQCIRASADTCLQNGQVELEVHGDSNCVDVAGCRPGVMPALVNRGRGAPCEGDDGQCDGAGLCRRTDICTTTAIGASQLFCPAAAGLSPGVCRFHVLPGSLDADPQPLDGERVQSCGQFCQFHGWTCVAMWENFLTCGLCLPDAGQICQVVDGCDVTIGMDDGDVYTGWDGMLCDCLVDGEPEMMPPDPDRPDRPDDEWNDNDDGP